MLNKFMSSPKFDPSKFSQSKLKQFAVKNAHVSHQSQLKIGFGVSTANKNVEKIWLLDEFKFDSNGSENLAAMEPMVKENFDNKVASYYWADGRPQALLNSGLASSKKTNLDFSSGKGFKLANTLYNFVKSRKLDSCEVHLPENLTGLELGQFLYGLKLCDYKYEVKDTSDKAKDLDAPAPKKLSQIQVVNHSSPEEETFWSILADSKNMARDFCNGRSDTTNAYAFFTEAESIASLNPSAIKIEKIVGDDLLDHNLNLIHAVGRGSSGSPPALLSLTYNGDPSSDTVHSMIGKGVIFDTGGYNLKPTGFMETMFTDKGGASAVLGAFKGIVQAGLKINITCTIPLAENFVSDNAYRPSDIIKSHKGLTVEIKNTDAEGRLILCDAMSWTQQKFGSNLKTMIELSTLTGACMAGLGTRYAGLFSNDQVLADLVKASGEHVNEPCWQMPIGDSVREEMKGQYSDLVNSAGSRYGGAMQAAAYLERFVEDGTEWVHLDIAGPSHTDKGYEITPMGATGFGTSLLIEMFRRMAERK